MRDKGCEEKANIYLRFHSMHLCLWEALFVGKTIN